MKIVLLLCAAFVLGVATEPIKAKLGVQPNMTQEAMPGPLLTQAVERKTKDEPLPVMEAGTRTLGGMRSSGYGCLPGWESYGSRCFKVFNTPMTWMNAEKYCMYFGAHLASVHNPGEDDLLQGMASQTGYYRVWVGGSDAVETFTWLWTDGSKFDYTKWSGGQPDNQNEDEKCMALTIYGWYDLNCGNNRPFICGTRPDGQL
ncbi:galactose-specific lectin nattectin-like [Scomber scombrus]|uniref:Galactose-specific lectin nattectin-like n=1 Tax=Scomber scombrus TaxID=13677 RepID=A0AAV1QE34_SCOSC